jgi:23S rRNA pseudouridine2605 synthase
VPRHRPRSATSRARPQPREEGPQRIAKLLARAGVASRRDVERMIAEGRIALNGEKLTTPATLLESIDGVTVDGKPVRPAAATRLFRFYKPQGTITAARDTRGRATIYDKLPPGLPRVMPVGRLDFMTEGLLLLTNDGELKRKLELPSTAVVRQYRARAFGHVTQAQLDRLAEGITIEGIHYGSIIANLERRTSRNFWIELSLTEGKNREVRRVLAHLGLQVSRLIRTAYGPLTLQGLEPGDADEVQQAKLEEFRRTLK